MILNANDGKRNVVYDIPTENVEYLPFNDFRCRVSQIQILAVNSDKALQEHKAINSALLEKYFSYFILLSTYILGFTDHRFFNILFNFQRISNLQNF